MLKRIKDSILDILRQADWMLLCLCCGAALFGLVMIASATNFLGSRKMVIVQACAIVLGVGIYFLMSQIDLTEASKRWKWLLGFGIVLFLLLKTPLGIENNGNRAWLGIRGFPANIQPAEIVKLTFILVLSKQLVWVKEHWGLRSLRSVAFLGGHLLLMVGLYYAISSDMGSAWCMRSSLPPWPLWPGWQPGGLSSRCWAAARRFICCGSWIKFRTI
mgnify:CR=1 FL=1